MAAAHDPFGLYRSPRSGARLDPAPGHLRARGATETYPVDDGRPIFLRYPPQEDPAEERHLRALIEAAQARGWRQAVASQLDPARRRYVTSAQRARFLDLLPIGPESLVLEVGPSLGQITAPAARRARAVYALEANPLQAAFLSVRCRQEGLDERVFVACGGDDGRLPYRDGAFHVALLNLVLEWCASRDGEEPPQRVHERLLAELHRVLAPGGVLWLTTKNRFALRYLLGKGDEHSYDLPFGSALPRPLLAALLRLSGRPRPPGLLHSRGELRGMLRSAGFSHLRSLWAAPEMRFPRHFVPTDAEAVREARRWPGFRAGESRATDLAMRWLPAGMVKHVAPGLTWVARKAA